MRLLQITKELVVLSIKTKPWNRKSFASTKNAVLIRETLERLGSVYIKLGQMLALRPDYVPDIFCVEFAKLLDQVPPFSSKTAKEILSEEVGRVAFAKIMDFEETPIASASFAQVHKAKLKNGKYIAIKIQRPGVPMLITEDIKYLKIAAGVLDFIYHHANKFADIVTEFESWTKDELDYVKEAENIIKFNNMATFIGDGVRGPEVYKNFSSKKVLTMEFIDGLSLNQITSIIKVGDKKKLEKLGFEGRVVITKILKNALETSHVHGFFHADPHPANIIFTPDRKLVYIDFGIVGVLTKKERVLILRHLRTLLAGDIEESFNAIIELCEGEKPDNLKGLKIEYEKLVKKIEESFDAKTYLEQQIKSGPYLTKIVSLMQANGLTIPVGIVRYFKSFETIEGLIFALYPELQVKEMLKEFRRVSIINIVDSLPEQVNEKNIEKYIYKLIDSIESSLILNN